MGSPTYQTVKRLFAFSHNICAFPKCTTPLVDNDSGKVTGRICHIKAQNPKGPRYDPEQTENDLHSFENLLLLCPVHHDIIDSNTTYYTVEYLRSIKGDHEKTSSIESFISEKTATKLIDNGSSIITSFDQSGGQTAQLITNIETNIERQIILNKPAFNKLLLETFSIDTSLCAYEENRFDPKKPLWPEDKNPTSVCYHSGGIDKYGKTFSSWEEAKEYGNQLREEFNHYSFYNGALHTLNLKRFGKGPAGNNSNYPVFYVTISNYTSTHLVLGMIEAEVHNITPLAAIGESHTLTSMNLYRLPLDPREGKYCISAIPSLKIEAGDAAAFHVMLEPNVEAIGSYGWLVTLYFLFGEKSVVSNTFTIVM